MSIELRLTIPVALVAVIPLLCLLPSQASSAARVYFAHGEVKAFGADGRSRGLAKGDAILSGETIDTGTGRAQVLFSDGAQVSLLPQTQLRIDDYRFEGVADGNEKGFFSLLKGGLRTITGIVGRTNRSNYKLSTSVATIGIRGTEFSVTYGNSISVTTGEGVIEVCNAAGCLTLNSGETAVVRDFNSRPSMSNRKTDIPPPSPPKLQEFISGNETDGQGLPLALSGISVPVVPLPNGTGGLAAAYVSTSGSFAAGLLGGNLSFASTGELSQFTDCCSSNHFTSGVTAEYGADGIIAWGRWASGTHSTAGPLATMSYVAGLQANTPVVSSLVRGYASFASTSAVITSGGSIVASGTPNSVTGTLNVNFATIPGAGSLTYSLNIPVAGQTFTVNGSATQYAGTSFLGLSSTITSTGAGCSTSCVGNIPYGDAIQGFFTGTAAQRAGANYGFTSQLGQVSGAVVFK